MTTKLQKLPIGIQTFEKLREEGYLYVDKTKLIHELITTGSVYFLSRPRRFGKSLTISTLDAIFSGKRELFKGLWIYNAKYDWQEYPVIRIDMSKIRKGDAVSIIEEKVNSQLRDVAEKYKIEINEYIDSSNFLDKLITEFSKQGKQAIVLVDEYDKPLLDNILDRENLPKVRDFLSSFYTIIKAQDANVRFVLLTGVTKFAKVSVFSGLNNLRDISMDNAFSSLCGYTQEELEASFAGYIKELSSKDKISKTDLLEKIKHWYNGFKFSGEGIKVYNPFSTLLLFAKKEFESHWFATGTPTFLIDLIRNDHFNIADINERTVSSDGFGSFEADNLQALPLLYQTGYLTIHDYKKDLGLYFLDYPNYEVKRGFIDSLVSAYSIMSKGVSGNYVYQIQTALKELNFEKFFEILRVFFANIPYDIQLENEKYYQSIFYCIFQLLGMNIEAESRTNRGRIDAVVKTKTHIFIFEFKLKGTKEEALQQIKEKEYAIKYKDDGRKIKLIGAAFNQKTRIIDDGDWVIEDYGAVEL